VRWQHNACSRSNRVWPHGRHVFVNTPIITITWSSTDTQGVGVCARLLALFRSIHDPDVIHNNRKRARQRIHLMYQNIGVNIGQVLKLETNAEWMLGYTMKRVPWLIFSISCNIFTYLSNVTLCLDYKHRYRLQTQILSTVTNLDIVYELIQAVRHVRIYPEHHYNFNLNAISSVITLGLIGVYGTYYICLTYHSIVCP
jgi:hypothetical protein